MYSYSDTEQTLESSLILDQYIADYMEYGLDYTDAHQLALFDLSAEMMVAQRGFGVDLDKLNGVQ